MQVTDLRTATPVVETPAQARPAAVTDNQSASDQDNAPDSSSVDISPEGAALSGDSTSTPSSADDESLAKSAHALKAFSYGALGLERPDVTPPHHTGTDFYTVGKWVAAGITIGGIISIFV